MSFSLLQSEYIQLSPIGVFPHAHGFQNCDSTALSILVKNFNSFLARLGRRFTGVPFYIGHPDVPGYQSTYPDRKAYGWIMDLQLREDGLYGRPKWSAAGEDLIANGHFKFLSPYWEATKIGTKEGKPIFSPTVLISVGLTNDPNLPVLPLANTAESGADSEPLLGCAMPLENEPLECAGETALSQVRNDKPEDKVSETAGDTRRSTVSNKQQGGPQEERPVRAGTLADSSRVASHLPNAVPARAPNQNRNEPPEAKHPAPSISNSELAAPRFQELENRLENCVAQIAELNARLVTALLDNAVAQARILPAERNNWRMQLECDFRSASAALANEGPKLNVHSKTDNLHRITSAGPGGQTRVLHLVNERMRAKGISYDAAWQEIKAEQPGLFV